MAAFDIEKAAKILGSSGGNLTDAIGMGFGAPNCIIGMSHDILKLLPSELLGSMAQTLQEARDSADNFTAMLTKKLFLDTGIIEFDTQTGKWKFVGDSSLFGNDTISAGTLENLGGFLSAAAAALAFGSKLYNNVQTGIGQIEDILNCVDDFKNFLAGSKGSGALASSFGLGEAGSCAGFPTITQPQACVAAGGTWVVDPPEKTCYGAEGEDQLECEANGGVWSLPIEPIGGVGYFGPTRGDPDVQFAINRNQMQTSIDFANNCRDQLQNIGSILSERQRDATLEPVFNSDGSTLPQIFSGTTLRHTTTENWQRLLSGDVQVDLDKVTSDGTENPNFGKIIEGGAEIFRLTFGPPKAKKGQFILTIDGLYYDSQSGGVPDVPVKFMPSAGDKYLHKYAPNLGGKGVPIGNKDLDVFMNTLFDPDTTSDEVSLQKYYDADEFLQQLIGEKNKHINDRNRALNKAITDASSTALIHNMRQDIVSQAAKHELKINKRKKQIEVAVVTPGSFGSETSLPALGNIPINDFTFLKDFNVQVSLEQQKNLTFTQADVTDVIFPLKPKYVSASGTEAGLVAEHLMIPTIGAGGIVFDSSTVGVNEVDLLSLADEVTLEGLISIYNFLEATAELPKDPPYSDSSKWGVLNTNSSDSIKDPNNPIIYQNAKLLSQSPSSTFVSGLSIPKLTGLVRWNEAEDTISLGSAVRLPESPEFNDLFYNPSGVSMEFWVHMPGIQTSSTSKVEPDGEWGPNTYNRLLIGCENTGGFDEGMGAELAENTFGTSHVKGFVMGFSRDRQILNDQAPSNDNNDNPSEQMCFFAAPTLSYNGSGVNFISTDEAYCLSAHNIHKFKVNLDITGSHGKTFSDVSSNFMHVVYTVSPSSNSMSVYLDGVEMATSGLDAFGAQTPYSYLAMPTAYKSKGYTSEGNFDYTVKSFEYNSDSIVSTGVTSDGVFNDGPKLDANFTPWILGGGYTDGFLALEGQNAAAGGFMNKYHGKTSGLNGFLGSAKFYSKALSLKEIKKNYNAQQGYFKNIDL